MRYGITHTSLGSGFHTMASRPNREEAMTTARKIAKEYPGLVTVYAINNKGNRMLRAQFLNGVQTLFTTDDVREAGYTLEPLICKYCGQKGGMTYHQYIRGGKGHCEICGHWQ